MNNNTIKVIEQNASAEIIEKRSRFIANIFYIESVKEAEEKIKLIKKKYYDAKHNCFAFCVIEDNQEISRMNDDGEPSSTAGEPILNVITKNGMKNVLIIVTRYFGGILLGAGGLVRAYSNASIEALKKCEIVEKVYGIEEKIELSYEENEKFKYYCSKNNIKICNTEYAENITYIVELTEEDLGKIVDNGKLKNGGMDINILSNVKICRKYIKKAK